MIEPRNNRERRRLAVTIIRRLQSFTQWWVRLNKPHTQKFGHFRTAAEAAMRALEDELATPQAWATRYESAKSEARHTAARRAVEEAYARLETLID